MSVDGKRWQQIQDIFYAALDMEGGQRQAFLDEACSGDRLLRQEVESLLASHEEAGSFLAAPAVEVAARAVADDQAELVMGSKIGPYKMLTKIGRGGMGEVYLAEDTRLGRKVALKLLPPYFTNDKDRLRRFQQEARAASALNHPNIITIFEIGQDGPIHFIATEYIQGETLRQRISRAKINISDALDITIQVANALSAAHEAGIAHRDIKPENIMLRPDGYVKVLDFGLAKLTEIEDAPFVSGSDVTKLSTEPGIVMGTVSYMSPEQARGLKVDARTDIFSLGVVFYEMIARQLPFEGETSSDVIAAILRQEPSPLALYSREVPQPVERIVIKSLAKERDERYQTARELLADLKKLSRQLEFEAASAESSSPYEDVKPDQAPTARMVIDTRDNQVTKVAGASPGRRTSTSKIIFTEINRRKTGAAIALVALFFLIAAIAFGIYKLAGQNKPETKVTEPFSRMKVARLTSIGTVARAAISPDGKYVVYVMDDSGKQSLWLRQSATTSNVQIAQPAEGQSYSMLAFSGDGNYIFYLKREGREPRATLYQMPVLGGEPKKLIPDISIQDTSSNISFSPDGKQLALIRLDENFERTLVIVNADGTGERKLASRTLPEYLAGAAWSPDGKIIACVNGNFASGGGVDGGYKRFVEVRVEDGTEKPISQQKWGAVGAFAWLSDSSGLIISAVEKAGLPQLWRISYPGGEAQRITNDLNGYTGVSLTADSKALVTTEGEQPANIWIAPGADTNRAKKITSASGDYNRLCWMPDGRIVYQSVTSGNAAIWIMNADATGQKQLTPDASSNFFPSATPDGRYIVFSSDRSGKIGIWRMDSDGGNPKLLADGGSIAHCSPDGKWVVYYRHSSEGAHLWRVPIEGGEPAQLTFKNATARPAISPDGKLIACNYLAQQPNSHFSIAILPFEGGEPIKVFDIPTSPPREIHWTPDGRALAYIETRGGVSNVWIQPVDGGPAKQLTGFKSDFMFSFDWSRDGRLVFSRGVPTSDAVLISDFK